MRNILYFILALLLPLSASAYTIQPATGTTGLSGIGAPTPVKVGQSFTTIGAGNLTTVSVSLDNEATSPTDNVLLDIFATSGSDVPNGASLGQALISATTVTNGCTSKTFTFTPLALSAATKYVLVFSRSGTPTSANYVVTCGTNSDTYANGTKETGSAVNPAVGWSSQTQDINALITIDSGVVNTPAPKLVLFGDW